MAMLIRHGTWMIIPGGLALAFVCNHIYAKAFPRLLARALDEEDRRSARPRLMLHKVRATKRPVRKATAP